MVKYFSWVVTGTVSSAVMMELWNFALWKESTVVSYVLENKNFKLTKAVTWKQVSVQFMA